MDINRVGYWDNFYSRSELKKPQYPSQFAAFVIGEVSNAVHVIEFGCGTGRDSEFFAHHGLNVTALDASESAIELCRRYRSYENLTFEKFVLGKDDINNAIRVKPPGRVILYARFLLHAISDEEENVFFKIAHDLSSQGSILALEYRCSGDEQIMKEFGQHFRRYLSHTELCESVAKAGFDVAYQVEGRGFAKYKSEDALVGRCIAIRNGR